MDTRKKRLMNWLHAHLTRHELRKLLPFLFLGTILAALLLFLLGIWTYATYVGDLATPETLTNRNNTGLIIYDRFDTVIYQSQEAKDFEPVASNQIPTAMKQATVAIEDKDFYKHPGVSLRAILRSLATDLRLGTSTAYGGSTITQQLVKNALLTPKKTLTRKLQEALLAWEVERRYTKDQIITMYLNSIYYGSGAYGISGASKIYFNHSVHDLTLPESALLAALPQAPSALSPFGGDSNRLEGRKTTVLTKMVEQGYVSAEEKTRAIAAPIAFAPPPKINEEGVATHFALFVRDYLFATYGENTVNRRGFRVRTTLDLPLQKEATHILQDQVKKLAPQHVSNGGIVTINPTTGEIVVFVGSADWSNEEFGKYNVIFAQRQPGSSFKPIVYTYAFTQGFKPTDILHDQPTDFSGYKPKNYDGKFRDEVTMRRALANSLNVPAVELLQKVGVRETVDFARSLGITTFTNPDRYGLSLVLGGGEVELFELTRAYGVFATGGELVTSHPILSIEDKLHNLIFTYNPGTKTETTTMPELVKTGEEKQTPSYEERLIGGSYDKHVVNSASTFLTTSILKDNEARSEVFGSNSALKLSRPAAAKTGTTDDYRDAWTVGYTTDLVTGVWIGNNDNAPMGKIAGSIGAAPIWQQVMEKAHAGKAVRDFTLPNDIVEVAVCKSTLVRACADCKEKYTEVFLKDNRPDNICPEEITPTPGPTNTPTPEIPVTTPLQPTIPSDTPLPQPSPALTPTPTLLPIPTTMPTGIIPTLKL